MSPTATTQLYITHDILQVLVLIPLCPLVTSVVYTHTRVIELFWYFLFVFCWVILSARVEEAFFTFVKNFFFVLHMILRVIAALDPYSSSSSSKSSLICRCISIYNITYRSVEVRESMSTSCITRRSLDSIHIVLPLIIGLLLTIYMRHVRVYKLYIYTHTHTLSSYIHYYIYILIGIIIVYYIFHLI